MTSSSGEAVHAAAELEAWGRAAAEAEERRRRGQSEEHLFRIKKEFRSALRRKNLSIPRFERGTFRMLGERHDQLDHTDRNVSPPEIESGSPAWQASIMPLDHGDEVHATPSLPPPPGWEYYLGSTVLDFAVRMGSGSPR